MASKPVTLPINLPANQSVPDAWLILLPEDRTESAVTGESENVNNEGEAENDGA